MNHHPHGEGRCHGHDPADHGHRQEQEAFAGRRVSIISDDLNEDRLRGHLEKSRARDRPAGPGGAETLLRYIEAELESEGLPVTVHECEVRIPPPLPPSSPSNSQERGEWRRIRFPITNIVPDGGTALFVLVGGGADASLLEMAHLLHQRRNELSHGVRIAWWNGGGGDVGFGPAEWYADNKFDLLRTRCMAYFNVDRIAGQSVSSHSPHATAELADWTQHMANRLSGQETEPGPPPRDADGSFLGVGLPSVSFPPPPPPPTAGEAPDAIDGNAMAQWTGFNANALFDLCVHPRAPLDLMTVADVLWGELEVLQEEVGDAFDFGEAGEAVKELVVVLEDHEEEHEEMRAGDFNRKMLDICLLLNPALYTENGPFGRDAGGNRGVLPGPRRALGMNRLDPESGEWKVLRAHLTRERNRLCATISRAILVGRG